MTDEPKLPGNDEPVLDEELLDAVHPGEILLEMFLEPLGLSQYRLAKDTSVPPRRINEIVHGKRAITADTALRLSRYFGNSALFWMRLQVSHDLRSEERRLGDRLDREVKPLKRAS
ncbi:MAG TPA: HigA family addiction module antitoxin [Thermoanaerobaculia bacterium]|nr:HigA family addiction module antitoxin [Thermoanaerobaculia bacterium]